MQEYQFLNLLKCLQFGRSTGKYTPEVRLFCLTMHYYSPRAYEYMRFKFKGNLPTVRTIRCWYSSVDGSPGFTGEAFNELNRRVELLKVQGKSLMVGLIFDEMSIRKHSQWDASKQMFTGHITAGKPVEYETSSPLAKEALVLMVSGIGERFKLPIGYFLCNGLCAQEKSAIVKEAMLRLHVIGIKVVSLTFDGAKTNIATAKQLGANFHKNKPYFQNPFDKKLKVYIILDPPHMLKLARNCLGNKVIIYNAENGEILWEFISDLVSLQIKDTINLGNKLTKTHIEYKNNKMNVRLAAETLSNSVAASIDFLNEKRKMTEFQNSEATTEYLRLFNNLFDTMNSKPNHTDAHFKRPFSETTKNEYEIFYGLVRKYIKGLKLAKDGRKEFILSTPSFTPFFGFYYNTYSFMGIYNDYIEPNGHDEFYTFDVSQDHVETFFGSIRSMGGITFN